MPTLPLLTYPEAADRLRVSTKTLRRLVAAGTIPAVRISVGSVRFDVADLDAYLAARKTEASAS